MALCCLTRRAGISPAISSCRKTSASSSCRRTRPELNPIERLWLHLRDKVSTPVVTLGIGCSAKPDEFDPCALSLAQTGRRLIRSVNHSRSGGSQNSKSGDNSAREPWAWLQDGREVRALPQFWDAQTQRTEPGIESAVAITVAVGEPIAAAFMPAGADQPSTSASISICSTAVATARRKSLSPFFCSGSTSAIRLSGSSVAVG
jgi:hypothetical protein